jgi:glutamate-ammonia-ligase adenylyltransferase
MGSLGAGRLHAQSDLDLIVIYDAGDTAISTGPRPLEPRSYFARLSQALITALTARMAEGRLYDVDMRLRPSGRTGPVATSLAAFVQYQATEAWTWEHLALTRARVVAGDAALGAEVEAERRAVLRAKGPGPAVRSDVAAMRARIAGARPSTGRLDVKAGAGRLMEIELAAQMQALMAGSPARHIEDQIATGPHAPTLMAAQRLFWSVHAVLRLLSDRTPEPEALGEGARVFLLRETGFASMDALLIALDDAAGLAGAAISAQLHDQVRE